MNFSTNLSVFVILRLFLVSKIEELFDFFNTKKMIKYGQRVKGKFGPLISNLGPNLGKKIDVFGQTQLVLSLKLWTQKMVDET